MTAALPAPGPSYLREQELRLGDRLMRVGIGRPTTIDERWWVALLWVEIGDSLATFRDLASPAGPPPDPPLLRLGPALSGELSGMIRETAGRQMLRLRLGVAPADEARPWDVPAVVVAAIEWEPARAATLRPNQIAETALTAFRHAVERLGRP